MAAWSSDAHPTPSTIPCTTAQVVTRFKSLSARALLREFPRVKRRLWGGELWEDGSFARTVGDKVTAEVIRRYIQQHRVEKVGDAQLSLFE